MTNRKVTAKVEKVEKATDDPYSHINKYIDIMKANKGKRIEIIVTGEGCSAHLICNSWDHCLRTVANLYSHKEGVF
tara:strand:+ start:4462 stop:4689 length:228 start_codon:yes stop_codon:yes gene_type:complete